MVFQNPTAAYTAGLLHGLGELLIHLGNPQKAQSMNTLVLPLDMRRGKIEQRILGYSYSHVSAALAQRWLLPQVVVDALQYQAAPFENTAYEPLAGVIHLAAWRVRGREAGLSERELAVTFPGEIGLMLLELTERALLVGGIGNNFDPFELIEHFPEHCAQEGRVFDEYDAKATAVCIRHGLAPCIQARMRPWRRA